MTAKNVSGKIQTSSGLFDVALDLYLVISFLYVTARVWLDYQNGGNDFKQGDWLINNAGGIVRRGHFGSLLLFVSDLLHITPLWLVCVIQTALLGVVYCLLRYVLAHPRLPSTFRLLYLSPALFPVFWVAQSGGSVRKEMIAFVGILAVALGGLSRRPVLHWCGVTGFCLSVFAHEAMTVFVPTIIVTILLFGGGNWRNLHVVGSIVVIVTFTVAWLTFLSGYTRISSVQPMCDALVQRGLTETICTGAIQWVRVESTDAMRAVFLQLTGGGAASFLLSYVCSVGPFLYLGWLAQRTAPVAIILVAFLTPLLPLYCVALDWGRWISLHLFSTTVVMVSITANYPIVIARGPTFRQILAFVLICILIVPDHVFGVYWGGLLRRFGVDALRFVASHALFRI
jgi:hypothetical protein